MAGVRAALEKRGSTRTRTRPTVSSSGRDTGQSRSYCTANRWARRWLWTLAPAAPAVAFVLEAPFTSAREVAARALPVLGPLLTWGLDSKRKIATIRAPVLIIHGTRDEVIPFELGQALWAAAHEPKWFWAVQGSGHNNILESAGAEYGERLAAFYAILP